MAHIAVSAEFVRPGRVGGLEQALEYLVEGLHHNCGDGDRLTLVGAPAPFRRPAGVGIAQPNRPARPRFVQETLTYWSLRKQVDAYYFPNYFTPPVPTRSRVVTTIPDLQYLHHPENFSGRKRTWLRAAHGYTLLAADAVTVYSEAVRADVADRYGGRAGDRVRVVPLPVSWSRFGDGPVAAGRPYVLAVASHYRHKNLATLVRAFAHVRSELRDLELVLAGQLGANLIGVRQADDLPALVRSLGLGGCVRVTGYVDDLNLGSLYRSASLFVFPSLFEGFGLPPVEALGFGLPVITTRCASLPEVTLGLADYVDDPHDIDELAALMTQRLTDGLRPTPEAVFELREHYSPRRIGAELYRVLIDA